MLHVIFIIFLINDLIFNEKCAFFDLREIIEHCQRLQNRLLVGLHVHFQLHLPHSHEQRAKIWVHCFCWEDCNTPQRNQIPLCSVLIDISLSSARLITYVSHSVLFLRNAFKCVQLKIVLFHEESVIDYKIFTPGDQFWFFLSFNHHFYSIFWYFGVFWHISLWYVCLRGECQKKLHNWTQATITHMSGLHYLTFNLGIYAWGLRSVISWFINSKRPLDRSLKALQSSHS